MVFTVSFGHRCGKKSLYWIRRGCIEASFSIPLFQQLYVTAPCYGWLDTDHSARTAKAKKTVGLTSRYYANKNISKIFTMFIGRALFCLLLSWILLEYSVSSQPWQCDLIWPCGALKWSWKFRVQLRRCEIFDSYHHSLSELYLQQFRHVVFEPHISHTAELFLTWSITKRKIRHCSVHSLILSKRGHIRPVGSRYC